MVKQNYWYHGILFSLYAHKISALEIVPAFPKGSRVMNAFMRFLLCLLLLLEDQSYWKIHLAFLTAL